MKHKIALLADVHGNATALQAVLADCLCEDVTEYWFLGDLILPGPGASDLFEMLEQVNTTVFIKGNWEDCFLEAINGNIDITDPSDIYLAKLSQYLFSKLDDRHIKKLNQLPLHTIKEVEHLKIGISHNLPKKNYGNYLYPTQAQENFNSLFANDTLDIAIYAHVHHPLMRYSDQDQLIISPGSIGQPFCHWPNLHAHLKAQYAILTVDAEGIVNVDFRKVSYNQKKELEIAKKYNIPYFELYQELLKTGKIHTHDKELLEEINIKYQYTKEIVKYMDTRNQR